MLSVIEKVILLQEVDLFERVPTDELAHLAAIAHEVTILRDETLYRQGEAADAFFLLLDGKVRLHRSDEEVGTAVSGEALGAWALFDAEPRVVTATALEDTRALKIEREDFVDLLADHVQITQGILKKMAHRLRGIVERIGTEPR